MHRLLIIVLLFSLCSCKDKRLQYYEQLVDRADRIVLTGSGSNDSVVINSSPVLEKMKNMLKRNIEPQSPRKFLADRKIALYSGGRIIGVLLASEGSPHVNFRSDSLSMTFGLTYGIGMSFYFPTWKSR